MEQKLSGIVLSSVSYGENDKILTLFTLEKGLVSAKIKGVKKAGAKLKFAAEPFCFAEYILTGTNFKTVINASLFDSFYDLREDIYKFYAGAVILEFVKKFLQEEIIASDLFLLTVESLKSLAYTSENSSLALIKFLLKGLALSGYGLNLNGCYVCEKEIENRAFFDYSFGSFSCSNCYEGQGLEINCSTYQNLKNASLGADFDISTAKNCLKLLNFYILNKPEVKLKTLDEYIKLFK